MRFCEECGAQLEDDARFCEECGTEVVHLEEEDAVTNAPEENAEPVALFCAECGAKLEPGVRFCEECGSPVEVETEEEISEAPVEDAEEVTEENSVPKVEEEPVEEQPEEEPEFEADSEEVEEEIIGEEATAEIKEAAVEEIPEEAVEETPEEPVVEKEETVSQPKNKLVGVLIAIIGVLLVVIVALVLLGLNKSGQNDKQKETEAGNNVIVGEDNVEVTPTPEIIVTATPEPTATTKPTVTPKPTQKPTTTSKPTPKPTATPKITTEDLFEIVSPEWRNLRTDSEEVKELKQKIRKNGTDVEHLFKDRMRGKDLITPISWLENLENELLNTTIYSYQTKQTEAIGAQVSESPGGLIHVAGDYVNALPDGYYDVTYTISVMGEEKTVSHMQTWYVAQSDAYQEPKQWYYAGNWIYKENYECVNVVVKPDSTKVIRELVWDDYTEIDKSLYEILYDGRVLRLSPELIQCYITLEKPKFIVRCADGQGMGFNVQIEESSIPLATMVPTPTEAPTPTAAPKPTVTPKPTEMPKPTVTPAPSPIPTLTPAQEEYYRTTAPEWRDIPTDSESVKEAKRNIREGWTVIYCFKDRLDSKGLVTEVSWLSHPENELLYISLYSYQEQKMLRIEEKFYEIHGDIVRISKEYIDTLSEGYYRLEAECYVSEFGYSVSHGFMWYVAESDLYQEPEQWLLFLSWQYEETDKYITATVRPDSSKRIAKLYWSNSTEVDESLYEILFDGQAVRFSAELLQQCESPYWWMFYVISTDGGYQKISIGSK